jgi:hypothetical protein
MHASGSAMRHHIDEPQAGKNQQGHENQGNRVHDHAMSMIIEAFPAFVFREVRDWCPPEVTLVRGSRSRPESYDTAISFVKVPGNHGDISPYLSGARFAPRPRPVADSENPGTAMRSRWVTRPAKPRRIGQVF